MSIQIINDGNTIKFTKDNIVNSIPKIETQVRVVGTDVLIDPASGTVETVDWNDVTIPTVTSAEDLRKEIVELINSGNESTLGISEHAKRDLGASTTFDVDSSVGDTTINIADTTGFAVDDLVRICNTDVTERSHFHITAVDPGVSLTLDRPLDNAFEIGDDVIEVQIGMNVVGSLVAPISFKVQPLVGEKWRIARILPTMLDDGAMDDGKFGGLSAITNGVTVRTFIDGVFKTLTNWKLNADLKDDMYDVTYSTKAPAGQHGLSGRWTFTKAQFVVDLDEANGDYLEILIQDDLSGLLDFEIKAQGKIFGT